MYNDDKIWDSLLESLIDDEEYLEEGFFDKMKEKRAKKKAEKADKKAQREIERSVVISEKEIPKMEKEFETTVKFLISLLKKEVPGAEFINDNVKKVSKRTINLKDGVDEHIYSLKIFQMDDDNYDKYKSKSKCEELRNADNSWDYVDELLQDNRTRIFDPIKAKGFDELSDNGTEFVREKNKNSYIHIHMGDEATLDIDVYMHFIVKKESVEESYDFTIDDYLEEGFFDKFKEKQKQKSLPKYDGSYGQPVSEKDVEKYKKYFEKTINDVTKIVKSGLPGCKLSDAKMYEKESKYADNICSIYLSKQIISIEENYYVLKKKFPDKLDGEDFDDEDGSILYDVLEERVFDKVERLGFECVSSGFYENKKYDQLLVTIDERCDDLAVAIEIVYKKESVQEGFDYISWDDEYLEEGFIDKIKEKRAEMKARKEEEERRRKQKEEEEKAARKEKYEQRKERMRREALGKYVMFSASEEESGPKQDLADLANEIKSLIKHEIPGVRFLDNKARHNTTRLDEGCVLHKYSLSIFKMDDVNLKKFIKNSKNTNLKIQNAAKQTAGTVQQFGRVANIMTGKFDYKTTDNIKYSVDALTNNMDELINDDFIERITDPIIDKGFVGKRNALVKTKDGMDYLGVKIESGTFDYEITVSVKYIIKPEGYMESFEPVEELFGFGKKKNKLAKPKNDPMFLLVMNF